MKTSKSYIKNTPFFEENKEKFEKLFLLIWARLKDEKIDKLREFLDCGHSKSMKVFDFDIVGYDVKIVNKLDRELGSSLHIRIILDDYEVFISIWETRIYCCFYTKEDTENELGMFEFETA